MTVMPAKVCSVCQKDVTNGKRVKDAQGRYYCAACVEARRKSAEGGVQAAAHAGGQRESSGGELDLAPAEATSVKTKPRPAAAAPAAAAGKGTEKLPEFCPNCGAKVFANRKLCFKCNRDVTKMDKVLALRAEEERGPSKEEVLATWIGRVTRVAMWVVIVGVVVILGWGMKLMFLPGGLWDNYPLKREAAAREFLQYVEEGTDKSYDKAYMLVSFRERSTGTSDEEPRHKAVFKRMHDEFVEKYGAEWLSKAKLENLGSNDSYSDDEVDFRLTLDNDTYTIATQVQLDVTRATANMTLPRSKKPVYGEDGKNHFGILDVAEYKVHPKRRMVELAGPGQPEDFNVPMMPPQR